MGDDYSTTTGSGSTKTEASRTPENVMGLGYKLGKGAVLFTGPDGIRDHRVSVEAKHRYVGEGTMSPEGTSEVDYLWRAPRLMPHPRPKSQCVGEIGWGIPQHTDWSAPRTGAQTMLGEFRQIVEDRHTHLFQNPWYPGTGDIIASDCDVMKMYRSSGTPKSEKSGNRPQTNGGRRSQNSCGQDSNSNNSNSSYRHHW